MMGLLSREAVMPSLLLAALLLAEPDAGRARSIAELHPCRADGAQALVGRAASAGAVAEAMRLSGAAQARIVRPGEPITMDYSTDRITIEVDARNCIIRLDCG